MRYALVILAALSAFATFSAPAQARCNHSWDSASDGSSCGGRAADQRPGGRTGWESGW